jgi:hypothetical protein
MGDLVGETKNPLLVKWGMQSNVRSLPMLLLPADEQPISRVLKHFRWHIEHLFDGLPDCRIRDVQAQRPAAGSQKPPPTDSSFLPLVQQACQRIIRIGVDAVHRDEGQAEVAYPVQYAV